MTKGMSMLNLSVKTTHTISTDDLEIYADPPLVFEAVGRINDKLHNDLRAWSNKNHPIDQTVKFVPRLFLSVSQNGDTYPLTTDADAQALREAVGDDFLHDLVESFWDYDYLFFRRKQLVSASSSPASATGNGQDPPT